MANNNTNSIYYKAVSVGAWTLPAEFKCLKAGSVPDAATNGDSSLIWSKLVSGIEEKYQLLRFTNDKLNLINGIEL